jgi:hypothetical protein
MALACASAVFTGVAAVVAAIMVILFSWMGAQSLM